MSKTKKTISSKMIAIILAIIMIMSICASTFYAVFAAAGTLKEICFKGGNESSEWGADSIDESKWAVYNYQRSVVKIKLARTSNHGSTYEYIDIENDYNNQIRLDDGQYEYKLAIDADIEEGVNYSLMINGNESVIPGEDEGTGYSMYGLNSEDINGNIVNVDISFSTPVPPGPEGPGEPPQQQADMQIWIGETLVIDDTSATPVTSYTGAGFKIHQSGWSMDENYILELLTDEASIYIEPIKIKGHGTFTIEPKSGTINIAKDGNDISIKEDSESSIRVGIMQGGGNGNVKLAGGVDISGGFEITDKSVQIGTADTISSKGIKSKYIIVQYATLQMYCSGELFTGATYFEGEQSVTSINVDVLDRGNLKANTTFTGTATSNFERLLVRNGGQVDITYGGLTSGITNKVAQYYDFVNFETTQEATELEDKVNITPLYNKGTTEYNNSEDKKYYEMEETTGNLKLKSLSKPMWTLSFNMTNEDGDIVDDTRVEHGTVKIITACGVGRGSDGRGPSDYKIEEGTPVTILLLPDYGYQFTSGEINGEAIATPEGDIATYKFNMPGNNLHLSAIFTKTEDSIVIEDKNIVSASIKNLEGQIKGNAEFKIEKAKDVNEAAFNKKAEGLVIAEFAELSLNEVILKGNEDEAWKTQITDLDEASTVTLKVSDEVAAKGSNGSKVEVLRQHNGQITLLNAEYNADTQTLIFDTDGYSTYAIAYKPLDKTVKDETPKTGNTEYIGIFTAVISILALGTIILKK